MKFAHVRSLAVAVGIWSAATVVSAQWAVIDVSAAVQWVQQLTAMTQQLQTLRGQLAQAESQYRAVTGSRNFGNYLMSSSDLSTYNTLPPDALQALGTARTVLAKYSELRRNMETARSQVTSLTEKAFKDPNSNEAKMWRQAVDQIAAQHATGQTAYESGAMRQKRIEEIIRKISATDDPKSIAELQARISGEETLLQNAQYQLLALKAVAEAQDRALQNKQSEVLSRMGSDGVPKVEFPPFAK
jgi:type IV secretion system protein VirB5